MISEHSRKPRWANFTVILLRTFQKWLETINAHSAPRCEVCRYRIHTRKSYRVSLVFCLKLNFDFDCMYTEQPYFCHIELTFLVRLLIFDICSVCFYLGCKPLPSVLEWRCWLGGRKGIRPVKNWVVGCWCGYLPGARCRLAYSTADATATHCLLLQ